MVKFIYDDLGGSPKLKKKSRKRHPEELSFNDTYLGMNYDSNLPVFFIYSKYKLPNTFEILSKITSDRIFENSVYYQLSKEVGLRHSTFVDLSSNASDDPISFGLGINIEL